MKKCGVLLAVSSLPGKYGIGDFSKEAIEFIKILKKDKINLWQILPLNPVGYGNSPYQPYSSFAFDEIYISLEDLEKRGLISHYKKLPTKVKTDYVNARKIKENAIYNAFENFKLSAKNIKKLNDFIEKNPYIDEYCEFLTLKELNDSKTWTDWTIFRDNDSLKFDYLKMKHNFAQMILFEQWSKIRKFANNSGIEIIGDMPFYVGFDSSDVYFHRNAFLIDRENKPTCVAGVPPDYFSATGQRWGNPIWDWEYLYQNDFKEMMDRIYFSSKFYDIVRIDHFRAFDSYWSIKPECDTAIEGEWKYPDGYRFFNRLFEKYPHLNIIVEDLGAIRQEVLNLRDYFKLPGMRVSQFHIYDDELYNKRIELENAVFYSSTHDNETMVQWASMVNNDIKKLLNKRMKELGIEGKSLAEKMVRYSLGRKENTIIISATDILLLGSKYRMNTPGTISENNWSFKLKDFNGLKSGLKKFF